MDPIWKKSGFAPAVLAVLALVLRWALDGQIPTTDKVMEVAAMWLALILYQAYRPTQRADQPGPPYIV